MTIENGELVPALPGIIKQRQQVENEQKAALLREQRDKLLYRTDKYMLPDYPITEEEREEYRQYRQYLRDIPQTDGFPQLEILTVETYLSGK
ncbi:MAG TPA: hypothetical protein IAA79_08740 [Candidatus Avirikenella pullistercoris]|nr:hypothetical protein [Candidatus Avirikenella pullistercoris]